MHGNVHNGLGNAPLVTERLYQALASSAVRKVQLCHDMTDQELADNIGCCGATVGNARNQNGQLAGRTFVNLMRVDPLAIDGLLHHFGRRSVPIEAKCDTDALIQTSAAVHKLAIAQADGTVTDRECLDIEPEIDAAIEALSAIKQRCIKIRAAA